MALISDPDFLIHSLRLNYLKHVEDPWGARVISLDPSYHANPYILDAGLADTDKWPELNQPVSVPPSDDESSAPNRPNGRPTGFPGATGLKYTTTIMGHRTGGMGLRVSGKRTSTAGSRSSIRNSLRSEKKGSRTIPPDELAVIEAVIPPTPVSPTRAKSELGQQRDGPKPRLSSSLSTDSKPLPLPPKEDEKPPPENVPIPFIPKFKGAAEMEARRRLRMMNRVPPGGGSAPQRPTVTTPAHLNPEISSSSSSSSSGSDVEEEEDGGIDDDDDDDFDDDAPDADDGIEIEADEFDPEFAASRGTNIGIDSNSDGLSLLSGSGSALSASNFSMVGSSSLPLNSAKTRNRLSPVHESRTSEERPSEAPSENGASDSAPGNAYFEMLAPAPNPHAAKSQHLTSTASRSSKPSSTNPASSSTSLTASSTITAHHSSSSSHSMFSRRAIPPVQPAKSALTAMLASTSSNSSSNPFTELYSAISGRSESESMTVSVFFPWAQKPNSIKAMELGVRKDATVEEVLGFALWSYWEEGWLPRLDEGLDDEEDPKWATKCSALGWIFRIAEDDGEVDEDFPPPDRTGRISKFNFDAYAVLEATAPQVQQNKILDSKIQRRPSRIVVKKKKSTGLLNLTAPTTATAAAATGGLAPPESLFPGTSAGWTSMLGTSVGMFPSSLGPSSSHGPPLFLRIRIADMADAGHFSTTIQASGGMYMAEVLETICAKRKLSNPQDYALVVDMNTMKILIPVDKTVKSLQGKRDLVLIKKNMLPNYGVEINKGRAGRSTDPNASIFKRNSEVPEQLYSSAFDYTTAYKRYTVYRKVPMLVGRSARLLAIDGGYIHIMPQSNKAKAVFDSGKTSSYDIKSIVGCQQSNKNSATFKLVVHRDTERNKRYEFEAESAQIANEIVTTIRGLKTSLDRSGTTKQSRRSRHVS